MFSKLSDEQKKAYLPTDERGPSPLPQKSGLTSPTSSTVSAQFLWHPNATDTNLFFVDKCTAVEGIIIGNQLLFDPNPSSSVLVLDDEVAC